MHPQRGVSVQDESQVLETYGLLLLLHVKAYRRGGDGSWNASGGAEHWPGI